MSAGFSLSGIFLHLVEAFRMNLPCQQTPVHNSFLGSIITSVMSWAVSFQCCQRIPRIDSWQT